MAKVARKHLGPLRVVGRQAMNCEWSPMDQNNIIFPQVLHNGKLVRAEKVVVIFYVGTHGELPFPQFRLTVVETTGGTFRATPNVVVRNSNTQCNEYVCGIGVTVEEAVVTALEAFYEEVRRQSCNKELEESDFVWNVLHTD